MGLLLGNEERGSIRVLRISDPFEPRLKVRLPHMLRVPAPMGHDLQCVPEILAGEGSRPVVGRQVVCQPPAFSMRESNSVRLSIRVVLRVLSVQDCYGAVVLDNVKNINSLWTIQRRLYRR